jgi:alpha-ketoglutarate-dependent taurine dioxygenase
MAVTTAPRRNEAATYTPLTPHIGCRVEGVDIAQPMSDAAFARLRRALGDHSLLVLPDQDITPEQHIAFSRRFGPLEDHVLSDFCLPGHPEIFVVSNIIEDGRHIGAYGGSKRYHSDLSYLAEPSLGSLFYCLECPGGSGQTAFASMQAAFDALPQAMQERLQGLDAVHDYVWNYERAHTTRPPLTPDQKAKTPPILHPAVRTHPETGRPSLFISEVFTRTFEGEDEAESQRLIAELMAFAERPEFVYVHEWTPGDLIIWDNRSSVHKAMPFDEANARRRMHRTTVQGDRPFRQR